MDLKLSTLKKMRFLFFHQVYILVPKAYKMTHIDPKSKTLDPITNLLFAAKLTLELIKTKY